MTTGWIAKAGAWTVEHVRCPDYAGTVEQHAPAKGVMHTTEGSSVEGALGVFRQHYAPHFVVGRDLKHRVRVLQLLPLGRAAAALEHPAGTPATNGVVRAQIEIVGFSQHERWKPDSQVLGALGALVGTLAHCCAIPLTHVPNPQRTAKQWAKAGWFGHDGVPANAHWDPGQLDWEAVFAHAARTTHVAPKVTPKPKSMLLRPRTYTLVRQASGLVEAVQIDRPH